MCKHLRRRKPKHKYIKVGDVVYFPWNNGTLSEFRIYRIFNVSYTDKLQVDVTDLSNEHNFEALDITSFRYTNDINARIDKNGKRYKRPLSRNVHNI